MSVFSRLKKIDLFIALFFLLSLVSYFAGATSAFQFFTLVFGIVAASRLIILFKRKILWKTRNRLIFSSLFFVVTPIVLVSIFFFSIIYIIIAQYGVIIVDNMVKRQLTDYERTVDRYLAMDDRGAMERRSRGWTKYKPSNLAVIFFEREENRYSEFYRYPEDMDFKNLKIHQFSGYFKLNGHLYLGVFKKERDFACLISMRLDENFLTDLSSISDLKIKFVEVEDSRGNGERIQNISRVADSSLDIGLFPWPYRFKFIDFDATRSYSSNLVEKEHFYYLMIDYDKLFRKIRGLGFGSVSMNIQKFIYFLVGLFAFFIIVSFFAGYRIIRVITKSINQISKGTERIRKGDFSVRIKIKSGDQLQYLAESFNEMASGIKRLLIEEKERQRLEEELRIARSIQLKLLPHDSFITDEFEIAAVNIPAEEIAGDYFDYFYHEGEYLYVLVADVSGKGASAAFYMAELKGVVNYLQKTGLSPAHLIGECHQALNHSFDKTTFITMNVARFHIPGGTFVFSRAGHTKALFYRRKLEKCEALYPEGMAVGLVNFSVDKIQELELDYESGDVLFLFSDGLSEIMNEDEEMLGIKKLERLICRNHSGSAEEIKKKILDFSIQFAGARANRDDLTFIVLKVK